MYQSVALSVALFIGKERSFERRRRNDPLTTWKNVNIESGISVCLLDRQPTYVATQNNKARTDVAAIQPASQTGRLMGAGNDKLVSVGRPNQR